MAELRKQELIKKQSQSSNNTKPLYRDKDGTYLVLRIDKDVPLIDLKTLTNFLIK